MKTLYFIALILLISCSSDPGWSKWRGPNSNGTTSSTAPWSTQLDSSQIIWQKNIGKGHSAITVEGNRCYTNGWFQNIEDTDTTIETKVVCLDTETGDELWAYVYPSSERSFPGPRATPVLDKDKLYVLSWQGKLFCLNKTDGREIWSRDIFSDSLAVKDRWGFCSSPVIHKDLLVLNLNTHGIALNKNNGELIWNSPEGSGAFSSTTLFSYDGVQAGTFMSDSTLYIVDINNGTVLNTYISDKNFRKENDVILTGDPKQLFLSNELIELQESSYKSVWRNDTLASLFRTGVVIDGYVYQFNNFRNKMNLYCVALGTGQKMWHHKYDVWGAVSAVDDKLVVISGLGKVYIVDTKPEAYTELSGLQVLPPVNKNTHWCWTAPSFADGKIFVRNANGDMACIQPGS